MKNIFKYASLLMAAAMLCLVSCQGTVDPEEGGNGNTENNGGNNNGNGGNGNNQGGNAGSDEDLVLRLFSDRNLLQTNVDVATLTVTLGDEVVTEGVELYDGNNNKVDLPEFKFKAEADGEYVFWALYGTYTSEEITIKAIDMAIPESPEDPEPDNTSFKTRVMLTEFTTVGCSACPSMKRVLHGLETDKNEDGTLKYADVLDKLVFTECHSGLVNRVADPCYLHNQAFEDFCAITGFPTLKFDIDYLQKQQDKGMIKSAVNDLHAAKAPIAPGIAVNSSKVGSDVAFKVTVKAAVDGEYRVGAFLLEDGIYAQQTNIKTGEEYMNTHNNVIRYVDSQYKGSFYGMPLTDILAGKTADIMFAWDLDEIWEYGTEKGAINGGIEWPERVDGNLHMVVFVSMKDADGNYFIANVIDCPLSGETPFEYAD